MRQIKFRGLTEGGICVYGDLINYENGRKAIIGRQLSAPGYLSVEGARISPVKAETVGQFTGLTDKNGVGVYEGDILNIYYTSSLHGDTYNHDGIYITVIGALGDIVFRFKKLLWDNYGHNQYPFNSTLSQEFNSLSYRYSEELHKNELRAIDDSTYFEVIGNVHEHPELLEQKQ